MLSIGTVRQGLTGSSAALRRSCAVSVAALSLYGLGAMALAGPAAAALPAGCSQSGATVTCTFSETGASQSWTTPSGVTNLTFVVDGASGGNAGAGGGLGGNGAQVDAYYFPTAGQAFTIMVGGQGGSYPSPTGGFNGGGTGVHGGGGGGFSAVYVAGTPLVVAGGGGGGGNQGSGPLLCDGTATGGSGGVGGEPGDDGQPGGPYTCSTETLGGGGGGFAGGDVRNAGAGGAAGIASGTAVQSSSCSGANPIVNVLVDGDNGPAASGSTGGTKGSGLTGGGGGGGYVGGGGGGGAASDHCGSTGGYGGGGGGTSFNSDQTGAVVTDGLQSGNGQVAVIYTIPVASMATQLVSDSNHLAPGTALSDKATAIQTAVAGGQTATACADLTNLLGLIKAQTGKKISAANVATLTSDVTSLQIALGC